MTIGPEPMMTIFSRSLRRGMTAGVAVSQKARFGDPNQHDSIRFSLPDPGITVSRHAKCFATREMATQQGADLLARPGYAGAWGTRARGRRGRMTLVRGPATGRLAWQHPRCKAMLATGLCAALLASTVPVAAQTDDENARRHFESGAAYLQQSDNENALREFQAAYSLSKRPALLLNIANVYERMGRPQEAVD